MKFFGVVPAPAAPPPQCKFIFSLSSIFPSCFVPAYLKKQNVSRHFLPLCRLYKNKRFAEDNLLKITIKEEPMNIESETIRFWSLVSSWSLSQRPVGIRVRSQLVPESETNYLIILHRILF